MELINEYWIPWSISNGLAIVLLIAALKKTKLARLFIFILFAWASWFNYTTVHKSPDVYLMYATFTPLDLYSNFINGPFKANIVTMVTGIAMGQALIAIGMLLHGWWVKLACMGAILFFLAIVPLGIGSGFPATLIGALAVLLILKKDNLNYLWMIKSKGKKYNTKSD